jgi:hypothetical protein
MSGHKNILRWLAILTAVVLLAAACGSDSGGDTSPFAPASESGSSDAGSDSANSDSDVSPFAPSNESDSSDSTGSEGSGSESSGSDSPPAATGSVNCDNIKTAFDSVGGAVTGTGSGLGGDDLRAEFDQYRAQLNALKSEAPELSADIDSALAGFDVLGEVYDEFDWDLSNLSDPQDALAFASLLTDGDVMGMFTAMGNIGIWITANCTS